MVLAKKQRHLKLAKCVYLIGFLINKIDQPLHERNCYIVQLAAGTYV